MGIMNRARHVPSYAERTMMHNERQCEDTFFLHFDEKLLPQRGDKFCKRVPRRVS